MCWEDFLSCIYKCHTLSTLLVVCPPVDPRRPGLCAELCSSDKDCDDGEKCCSNGCGHQCRVAVKEKPCKSGCIARFIES